MGRLLKYKKGVAADLFHLFVVSVEDDVTSRAEENAGMKIIIIIIIIIKTFFLVTVL